MTNNNHISPTMQTAQGMRAIIIKCLGDIEGNAIGVRKRCDSESLHQMRVGMRRLRSVLSLIKNFAPLPDALQSELDWVGKELGNARDWDVLNTGTLPTIREKFHNIIELVALQKVVSDIAHGKCMAARKAVSSVRYTSTMQQLSSWALDECWHELLATQRSNVQIGKIKKFADIKTRKLRRNLLKSVKNIELLDPVQRHHVRISAKKLRYATEFFESLYSHGKIKKFVRCLSRLQELLGKMNDARVADQLLLQVNESHHELTEASNFARNYLAIQDVSNSPKLKKMWSKFRRVNVPF